MKSRIFICFVLTLFIVTPIIADDISTTECMKMLTGTWVNEKYKNLYKDDIWINNPDGTYERYREKTDENPWVTGPFEIKETWKDSEGNIWYKATRIELGDEGHTLYELGVFENSGTIWKFQFIDDRFSDEGFPVKIDPDHVFSFIYYRQ